jgi:hypothetical protein
MAYRNYLDSKLKKFDTVQSAPPVVAKWPVGRL